MLAVLNFSIESHCVRMKRRTYLITAPTISPTNTRSEAPADRPHSRTWALVQDRHWLSGRFTPLFTLGLSSASQHERTFGGWNSASAPAHFSWKRIYRRKYWTRSIILKNDRKQSWLHSGDAYRELVPKNVRMKLWLSIKECGLVSCPDSLLMFTFAVRERMLKAKVLSIHPSIW